MDSFCLPFFSQALMHEPVVHTNGMKWVILCCQLFRYGHSRNVGKDRMRASAPCINFVSGKLCSDSPDFPPNLNRIDRLDRGVCVFYQTIPDPRSSPRPLQDIPVDCIASLLSVQAGWVRGEHLIPGQVTGAVSQIPLGIWSVEALELKSLQAWTGVFRLARGM